MVQRNQELWEIAQARASFKIHCLTYFIINTFFWILWWVTMGESTFPWPIYPMLGWGIGLGFHYWQAYHGNSRLVQKEYEKLKDQQQSEQSKT